MAKKFMNLSPTQAKGIDRIIFKNGLQLYKDAITIAEVNKSFSSSTSLLILGSEEVIKAIVLLLHSEGFLIFRIKDSKKLFSSHEIKHDVFKFIELASSFLETFIKYSDKEALQSKHINTSVKWINSLVNGFSDVLEVLKPMLMSAERYDDIQNFNAYKNAGFYVDYHDEIKIPQEQFSIEKFAEIKQTVLRLIKFYKGLRLFFHESIKYHMDENDLKDFKNELKSILLDIENGKHKEQINCHIE